MARNVDAWEYLSMTTRWVLALCLTLVVVGCKVGPDFHSPQRKMPATWLPPTTAPTTQNASIPIQQPADVALWWRNFNDPHLDSLVDRAVRQNLDLQAA